MWQMVFAHISVKGWIIEPYVQSLFYCPNLVQVLPPNNFEIIDGNPVTTDVTMVIYGIVTLTKIVLLMRKYKIPYGKTG